MIILSIMVKESYLENKSLTAKIRNQNNEMRTQNHSTNILLINCLLFVLRLR